MIRRPLGKIVAIVQKPIVDLALDPRAPLVLEAVINDELDRVTDVEPERGALDSRQRPGALSLPPVPGNRA